jgi:hypothetical protein
MSITGMTAEAAAKALNGYDLIGISEHFGKPLTELDAQNLTVYALAWAHQCRVEGKRVPWQPIMEMPLGAFDDYFDKPAEENKEADFTPTDSPEISLNSSSQQDLVSTTTIG